MKNLQLTIFTIAVWFFFVACGGGGSSGGGGGTTNNTPSPYAGTYVGTITLTFKAPGLPSQTEVFPAAVTITQDGSIFITDSEGSTSSGSLNGNMFSITDIGISETISGITCTGDQTFTGQVDATTVTGNVVAAFACTNGPITINVTATGPINATKTTPVASPLSRSPTDKGFSTAIHRTVEKMLSNTR